MKSFNKNIWILVIAIVFISFGCKKEVQMRKATVTVADQSDQLVSSAKVTVYVNSRYANSYVDPIVSDTDEEMTKEVVHYTNSAGVTTFEFDRNCVYEAKAEKIYDDDSTKTGGATLVFKDDADFFQTIIIR